MKILKHTVISFIVLSIIIGIVIPVKANDLAVIKDGNHLSSRIDLSDVPEYSGIPVVVINNNIPDFYIWQIDKEPYVSFKTMDELGRTGAGMACIGKESFPAEPRGPIGKIQPSGWHTVRYDDLIEDKYLYNRCHVIGYQLCGDNSTPENLFTGTRYLNTDSMLYFENTVKQFVVNTGEHVLYRVSPVYKDDDLVASGVQMEAFSVEDLGKGLCFNVFLYNVQPGIQIDYSSGDSKRVEGYSSAESVGVEEAYKKLTKDVTFHLNDSKKTVSHEMNSSNDIDEKNKEEQSSIETDEKVNESKSDHPENEISYVLNTNTKKFHLPSCESVSEMKEKNRKNTYSTKEELIKEGYTPCARCNP